MKSEKGITLATLVLTIIVMLILAGTTAFMLNSSNSATTAAQNIEDDFQNKTDEAEKKETSIHEQWKAVIDKKGVDTELSVP